MQLRDKKAGMGGDGELPPAAGHSQCCAGKRGAIMQAAERLFTTRRVHEISMEDVAAAAKVAKGTLYNHFHDKDDLFFQTCVAGFDELCELLESRAEAAVPFHAQLLDTCREISGFFDRRRQLLRMMQAEDERMNDCHGALRNRWMLKRRRLVKVVARILDRGIAGQAIRKDVPGEVLANLLMAMLRARAHGLADAPPAMRSHEVIVDLFCNGAGRTEKPPRRAIVASRDRSVVMAGSRRTRAKGAGS